jgi:hypothetical protein
MPGVSRVLGAAPLLAPAPPAAQALLHVAALAVPAELCLRRVSERRLIVYRPGWIEVPLPEGEGPLRITASPAGVVSLSLDEAGAPWLRPVAPRAAGLIPEDAWQNARILGRGAMLRCGTGPARPFLALRGGEAGWIILPALAQPPLHPRLALLRGLPPLATIEAGRAGLTLTLRAGAACEVLWEDVAATPLDKAGPAA